MRKWANISPTYRKDDRTDIFRIMLHSTDEGVYVYLYDAPGAVFSCADQWFEDIESAEDAWGAFVDASGWHGIGDPMPNCQHDCIEPIRIKGRGENAPQWGQYEILKDGAWEPFALPE